MKRILLWIIKFYQTQISANTLPRCRYIPTCSQYAVTAIQMHGAFFGVALAVWRVLRCNPFSKGGLDEVPDRLFKNR